VKLKEESAQKLALQKEVLQLKLISAESEQANQSLRKQLAEVSKALAREQAEHQATSAAVTDLRTGLVSREQQLAEARQLLDSMSAELGILSSRYHRLQQERDALRFARRQQQQQQQSISQPSSSLEPLTGAAAAAAQLQQRLLSGGSISIALDVDADSMSSSSNLWLAQASRAAAGLERSNSQPSADLQRSQEQQQRGRQLPSSPAAAAAAAASESSSSRSQSAGGSSRDGSLPVEPPAAAGAVDGLHHLDAAAHDEPVRLCEHGQLEAACLLCICQRFLAATAGSCSHLGAASGARAGLLSTSSSAGALPAPASPGGSGSNAMPSAAGLATVAVAACASEAVQYRQFLSISELARNRLEAENATLQQQATDLQRQVDQQQQQLRVLQANPAALSACTIQELTALEGEPAGWREQHSRVVRLWRAACWCIIASMLSC
jgi:chromosome segregation ATPase